MNTSRYLVLTILILSLISSSSCSKKPALFPIVTIALHNNEEGTILISSSGQGKSESMAIDDAEKKAFNTLLFYGFPSSVQSRPMIENEMAAKQANPSYFTNFFDKKTYKSFIVYTSESSNIQKSGKTFYLLKEIKINLRSLRNNLEINGIIRKFGF